MRRFTISVALLVALGGCPHEPTQPIHNQQDPVHDKIASPTEQPPVVTRRSDAVWSVSVTRTEAGRSATASIEVTTAPTPATPAPHAEVAAAEAWLAVARAAFEAGVFGDAVAAAHKGITALGADYRPKLAKDDTTIRIAMADEELQRGDAKAGATSLIAVLDTRIFLYFRRYADTVHAAP